MPISAQHTKFDYPDYISPLPADDFIKVAVRKQEMFDEGVSKIQTQLDSTSALRDLMTTDAEKQYFDESLSNLVKSVNSSAGLDFSVKGNVQAVLNIGKPFETDQYIKTAVSNGKEIQRRQSVASSLKGNQKSANNDLIFWKDVMDYKNSNKLGQKLSYGKEYEEFYDISESWSKFFKTLPESSQQSIMQGKGTPSGYFELVTTEGFTKSEIADKFKSYLGTNPKALRQLQIDTEAGIYSMGKEQAHKGYVESMSTHAALAEKQIPELQSVVTAKEKAYKLTQSPTVKAELDMAKQNLSATQQTYLLAKEAAATPFDSFDSMDYAGIYQNNMINNMANLYSAQKTKRDLKEDKVWSLQQENNQIYLKHNLDLEKERAKINMESMKPENLLKDRKNMMEMFKVDAEDFTNVPSFFDPSTFNLDVDKTTIKNVIQNSKKLVEVTPLGPEKKRMETFITKLASIDPTKSYVIALKNGSTAALTGEELQGLSLLDLDRIQGFAKSNNVQDYTKRRQSGSDFLGVNIPQTTETSNSTNTTKN
jgi:hypothetical protein